MTRFTRGLSFREAFFLTGAVYSMCSECGASGNQCEERFHACLAKEFEDIGYGAVHHLTVSAYMLQHSSKLTRAGWLYERDLLRDFLVNNKPPAQVRQQNRDRVDSGKREFKIKSRDAQPKVHQVWSSTILSVRLEDAAQYREDVMAWARSVLQDSERVSI